MKLKTCKSCKEKFEPIRPLQQVCSVSCSYNYQKKAFEKKMQKEKVEKKKELMTLSDWIKIAQQVVNKYIRERDKNEMNCVSCGKTINGVRHASHYLSAGNNYAVRFNTDNIWVSCYKCNVMLSGNQSEYRIRLIQKIGTKRVEYLELIAKDTVKYTINDLQEIIKEFKQKIKELKLKQ